MFEFRNQLFGIYPNIVCFNPFYSYHECFYYTDIDLYYLPNVWKGWYGIKYSPLPMPVGMQQWLMYWVNDIKIHYYITAHPIRINNIIQTIDQFFYNTRDLEDNALTEAMNRNTPAWNFILQSYFDFFWLLKIFFNIQYYEDIIWFFMTMFHSSNYPFILPALNTFWYFPLYSLPIIDLSLFISDWNFLPFFLNFWTFNFINLSVFTIVGNYEYFEMLYFSKLIYLILIYFTLYFFFYNSVFIHINLLLIMLFNNKSYILLYEILFNFLYQFKFFILNYKPFPHFYYKKGREGRYAVDNMTYPFLDVLKKLNPYNDIFFKWDFLIKTYKNQMISIFFSLCFRLIYFISIYFILLIYYVIMRLLLKSYYFSGFFYILLYIYTFFFLGFYNFVNLKLILKFWVLVDYIKIELFLFLNQTIFEINMLFLWFLNFFYYKKFNIFNHDFILAKKPLPTFKFLLNIMNKCLPVIQNLKIISINFTIIFFIKLFQVIFYFLFFIFFKFFDFIKYINYRINFFFLLFKINIYNNYYIYLFFAISLFLFIFIITKDIFIIILLFIIIILLLFYYYNFFIFNIFFWFIGFTYFFLLDLILNLIIFIFRVFFFFCFKLKYILIIYLVFTLGLNLKYIILTSQIFIVMFAPIITLIYNLIISWDYFTPIWDWFYIGNIENWTQVSISIQDTFDDWIIYDYKLIQELWENIWQLIKGLDYEQFKKIFGPYALIRYVLFELEVPLLIYLCILYTLKSILVWIYLNFTPFIFIEDNPFFVYFYFWELYRIILFSLKYIYIYFLNLYLFFIPYSFGSFYISKCYKLYSILFYFKYYFLYYFFFNTFLYYFLYYMISSIYYFFINIYYFIEYLYILYYHFYSILDFYFFLFQLLTFLNIILIDFIVYLDIINKSIAYSILNLPKFNLINLYTFVNYWYEFQSNLDIIFSYFRVSRYAIKLWVYKGNYTRNVTIPTILSEIHDIELEEVYCDGIAPDTIFKLDNKIFYKNINFFIKYFHWHWSVGFKKNKDYLFFFKYNGIFARIIISYLFFIYFIFYIFFKLFHDVQYKNKYFYNSQYLWGCVRSTFKKKIFKKKKFMADLIDYSEEINKNASEILHDIPIKISFKKKYLINYKFFKYCSFFMQSSSMQLYRFLLNLNIKKKKFNFSNLSKILPKNYLFFKKLFNKNILDYGFRKFNIYKYIYKKKRSDNIYYDFLSLKEYSSFYYILDLFKEHFFLFLAYIFKKNKYVPFIFLQEFSMAYEPINERNYLSYDKKNFFINKKIMNIIIDYFNTIDYVLFNKLGPIWLLNKNRSTLFLFNSLINKSQNLLVSTHIPFELEFFFLCVLFQVFITMFFKYGLMKTFFGNILMDYVRIIFIIISGTNLEYIWNFLIYYLNFIYTIETEYNPNCIIVQETVYIVSNNKLKFIDYFLNYRNLYDLDKNYFFFLNSFYGSNSVNIFYKIRFISLVVFLFFIYFLKRFKNFKSLHLLRNVNYKSIISISLHYKLKLWSWKNYWNNF